MVRGAILLAGLVVVASPALRARAEPTPAALAARSPIDVTILRTVSLPWQDPEIIVSMLEPVQSAHIEVVIDGGIGPRLDVENTLPGTTRSLTWKATAGKHYCEVRVWGLRDGDNFRRVWAAQVDVLPPLEVTLAPGDVDLATRSLRFRARSPIATVELEILDVDGRVLHQASSTIPRGTTGKPVTLTWPELSAPAAKVALRVFGAEERADSWAEVEWSPVQVEVPHDPIFFRDTIVLGSRADKLNAAYQAAKRVAASYSGVPGLRLYVLGLAKVEGQAAFANDRAQAVAKYFKSRGGVGLPIFAGASVEPGVEEADSGYVQAFVAVDEPAHSGWIAIDDLTTQPAAATP